MITLAIVAVLAFLIGCEVDARVQEHMRRKA